MTDPGLVLDTACLLAYSEGTEAVGEQIAAVADRGQTVIVPALCLAEAYRQVAVDTIDVLLAEHLDVDGALRGGCYDLAGEVACRHELIWGDYFLAAVLAALCDAVPQVAW